MAERYSTLQTNQGERSQSRTSIGRSSLTTSQKSPFTVAKTRGILGSRPSAVVRTTQLDLSSRHNPLEVDASNIKDFQILADNVVAVPRNPVIKILFAAYLFVSPFKDSYNAIIDNDDIIGMKKIIKTVFNSKTINSEDGLLSLMRKYDETPFKDSEPNYKKLSQILRGADMVKTNPKSLHSKLPGIWNWVYDHMKDSNNEFSEEFKSPLKNFASPRTSVSSSLPMSS